MKLIANGEDFNPLANWVNVFLNDVDVTHTCAEVDDIEGYVICFKRDEQGHWYYSENSKEPAAETLYGNVRIELKPDAPAITRELFNQLRNQSY